jgi:hypothetical protein
MTSYKYFTLDGVIGRGLLYRQLADTRTGAPISSSTPEFWLSHGSSWESSINGDLWWKDNFPKAIAVSDCDAGRRWKCFPAPVIAPVAPVVWNYYKLEHAREDNSQVYRHQPSTFKLEYWESNETGWVKSLDTGLDIKRALRGLTAISQYEAQRRAGPIAVATAFDESVVPPYTKYDLLAPGKWVTGPEETKWILGDWYRMVGETRRNIQAKLVSRTEQSAGGRVSFFRLSFVAPGLGTFNLNEKRAHRFFEPLDKPTPNVPPCDINETW